MEKTSPEVQGQGNGKGQGKGETGSQEYGAGDGKVSLWDPKGCARCGRSNHWARDCKAQKIWGGGFPKEKPKKKTKGGARGQFAELGKEEAKERKEKQKR